MIQKEREEKRAATRVYDYKKGDKKAEIALKTFEKKRDFSCTRKTRYKTKEAAEAIVAEAAELRNTTVRVYACTFCYGFHLTHQNDMSRGR
jgi:hypothetical protein